MGSHALISGVLTATVSFAACADTHGLDPLQVAGSIRCGSDACDATTENCLVCLGNPRCVERLGFIEDNLPDWWTSGQQCDPPLTMYESADEFACDDASDCQPGSVCGGYGIHKSFCVTEALTQVCGPTAPGILCDDLVDCPACATSCEEIPALGRGFCASEAE